MGTSKRSTLMRSITRLVASDSNGSFRRFTVIVNAADGNRSQESCSETDHVPNIALANVER